MSVRIETQASPENAQTFRQRLVRYAPLLVWMALIFFASTGELSASNTSLIVRPLLLWLFPDISEHGLELAHSFTRKIAHFIEYAILSLLAARAFSASHLQFLRRFWFVISLLLVALYAFSDEFHQTFVPARTGSIYDSLIDIAGGLTALVLFALWRRRAKRGKGEG